MKHLFLFVNFLISKALMRKCGWKSTIRKPLFCSYKFIEMGSRSHIKQLGRIEAISSWGNCDFSPRLLIGSHVSIQQNVHITFAGVLSIGDGCLISPRVTITDIHHVVGKEDEYPSNTPIVCRKTTIGRGVFIGSNAVVLPGTTIGDFAVIGANQVVSGVVPDRSVVK